MIQWRWTRWDPFHHMWLSQLIHVPEGLLKDLLTSLEIPFSPPVKSYSTFSLDENQTETGAGSVGNAPYVSWLSFGQLEMLPNFPGLNVTAFPSGGIFSDS